MGMQERIRDFGVRIGELPTGRLNKITDVPGVRVGHCTVDTPAHKTGVTVVLPCLGNIFDHKLVAASQVINGFGKTAGLVQIDELGTLETPIALTNTLNVGLVQDAMVEYMIGVCQRDGIPLTSINPVVCECNDGELNDIRHRAVGQGEVLAAIEAACEDFEEGDVGGGKGMVCHSLKGGIGSASRILTLDGRDYTMGVLVQSNYGRLGDLVIEGDPVGKKLCQKTPASPVDKGSIIMILATDLPLSHRQLQRVIRRCGVGLARTGSYTGHGSGEVVVGFTTANQVEHRESRGIIPLLALREGAMDLPFRGAAECCEEAVLNSMVTARAVVGWDGRVMPCLRNFWPKGRELTGVDGKECVGV